jgi:hypothetical protein
MRSPQIPTVVIDSNGISAVANMLGWPVHDVLNVAEALVSVVAASNFSTGGLNVAPSVNK